MPSPAVDAVMADQRAASFTKRSIKGASKRTGLRLALGLLDLTTLEGKDSPEKAAALCAKAVNPATGFAGMPAGWGADFPPSAAVCVYPSLVARCVECLTALGARDPRSPRFVRVASVATGFPSGQYPLDVRLDDTRRALAAGADEIDMVINRGAFLAGDFATVAAEIAAVKTVCLQASADRSPASPAVALKVILETGELETLDNVRRASDLAIRALHEAASAFTKADAAAPSDPASPFVVDFIKTSTGKVTPAATMPVTLVMLEAVRDWFLTTGRIVGVKPAGGIRTAKQALHYLVMVKETLGHLHTIAPDAFVPGHTDRLDARGWIRPELWRFGASALANDILRQLAFATAGKYRAHYDVTEG